MIDIAKVQDNLKKVTYLRPQQYLEDILIAFDLPFITIKKIIASAEKDSFKNPLPVFRRAVLYISEDSSDLAELQDRFGKTYRLLIIIGRQQVHCKNTLTMKECIFPHSEISDQIDFFYPLIYGLKNEKDIFATLSLSSLVSELFNELCLIEENKFKDDASKVTNFTINLLILAVFNTYHKSLMVEKFLNWTGYARESDYSTSIAQLVAEFHAAFPLHNELIASPQYLVTPQISKRGFNLCTKILSYDMGNVDGEVLGSLIYKFVVNDQQSSIFGYHTSYENIERVLSPLYVDDVRNAVDASNGNRLVQTNIIKQLIEQKYFDPTNSPGSFLTAALNITSDLLNEINSKVISLKDPCLDVKNFVGLVDNAVIQRISHLSVWVTYLQYLHQFKVAEPLDLINSFSNVRIFLGNQLTCDWESICPNSGNTLVIGSPNFKGAKKLSATEKREMKEVFGESAIGDLDYSSCWLLLSARYIKNSSSKCALVLTNSICQGVQVAIIWPEIFKLACEISFAHRSFRWRNGSNYSSGVSVVIVGLVSANHFTKQKYIFSDGKKIVAENISPYLLEGSNVLVKKSSKPISTFLPVMRKGNMPYDDQHLLLDKLEVAKLLKQSPEAKVFLKRIVGSDEFINNLERWCLWISTNDLPLASIIPEVSSRITAVKTYRAAKTDSSAQALAARPHQFREFRATVNQSLVIPSVSSENRPYIPIGFIGKETIVSNLAFAIYECKPWIFGVISSRIHMVWIRTVCGALETRIRYSSRLGYNTFPFPSISQAQEKQITTLVMDIIAEREKFSESSLGALYSNLPQSLVMLHGYLDETVDHCYNGAPFTNDMDRLKVLFELYEEMINK